MAILNCPKCGKEISDEVRTCPDCGYCFSGDEKRKEESAEEEQNLKEGTETIKTSEVNAPSIERTNKVNMKLLSKSNVVWAIICVFFLIFAISTNQKLTEEKRINERLNSENNEVKEESKKLNSKINDLQAQIDQLKAENEELSNGAKKQLSDIKNAFEKKEWQNVIDLSSELHEKYNGSAEDVEAQELVKASQKKIDKQNAKEEAEKAKGYETGITYNQLARTPDKYKDKKVKFSGKVIQVIEGGDDDSIQIRLAVKGDYDKIIYGEYLKSIVSSRVLEDDQITIYGTSVGTISYESTMGGVITIPGVYIEKIKQ